MNGYQNDTCLKEIELIAQNMIIILDSIVYMISIFIFYFYFYFGGGGGGLHDHLISTL